MKGQTIHELEDILKRCQFSSHQYIDDGISINILNIDSKLYVEIQGIKIAMILLKLKNKI